MDNNTAFADVALWLAGGVEGLASQLVDALGVLNRDAAAAGAVALASSAEHAASRLRDASLARGSAKGEGAWLLGVAYGTAMRSDLLPMTALAIQRIAEARGVDTGRADRRSPGDVERAVDRAEREVQALAERVRSRG